MNLTSMAQPILEAAGWAVQHPVKATRIIAKSISGYTVSSQSAADVKWWQHETASMSHTGRPITDDVLYQSTAVFSALKLITETIGTLPMNVYERQDKGRKLATGHPLQSLVHLQPSAYQTSTEFFEGLALSLALWQQAYMLVERLPNGKVTSMRVIPKPCVRPVVSNNRSQLAYDVTREGRTQRYTFGQLVPIRGFGHVGDLEGLQTSRYHTDAYALALAAEEYGARFFQQGARPSGVFMIDKTLTEDQHKQIQESLEAKYQGLKNSHKAIVLQAGMKYEKMAMDNKEAQFIEVRKFQIAEIARIFRTPLHMLYEMDRATYANAEQDNQNFLRYTLRSYLVRIERAVNAFVLTPAEQRRYYVEFNVEGLLRGDSAARVALYTGLANVGAISPAEIREKENMPYLPGLDKPIQPLNMGGGSSADAKEK